MPENPTKLCPVCGAPIVKRGAARCKPCAMRKRFADERGRIELPNPSGLCQCGCGGVTPIAEATRYKLGLVRGEHTRWILGHQSRKEMRANTGGALWTEEDRGYSTPCRIWQGGKRDGYAYRRNGKAQERVHLALYIEQQGPLPEGMVLDHLCQQRDCINIEHLEVVSIGENVRRGTHPKMVAFRNGTCTQGHPKTEEFGYRRADGKWVCRPCRNAYKRRHHATHSSDSVPSTGMREPSELTQ